MPFGIDQKKWENFWYYYKIHVFAGGFMFLLLIILVRDCAQRVEPDLTIYYSALDWPTAQVEAVKARLQTVVQDANADQKISFLFAPSFNEQKLMVVVMVREAQLLILERPIFEVYAQQGAFQPLDELVTKFESTLTAHPEVRLKVGSDTVARVYGFPLVRNRLLTQAQLPTEDKYLVLLPPAADNVALSQARAVNARRVFEYMLTSP